MTITVNGREHTLSQPVTVAELLTQLKIDTSRGVAVERNREIVPRGEHTQSPVRDGDTFEIITAFAGG